MSPTHVGPQTEACRHEDEPAAANLGGAASPERLPPATKAELVPTAVGLTSDATARRRDPDSARRRHGFSVILAADHRNHGERRQEDLEYIPRLKLQRTILCATAAVRTKVKISMSLWPCIGKPARGAISSSFHTTRQASGPRTDAARIQ
jgi:hypothetical protein